MNGNQLRSRNDLVRGSWRQGGLRWDGRGIRPGLKGAGLGVARTLVLFAGVSCGVSGGGIAEGADGSVMEGVNVAARVGRINRVRAGRVRVGVGSSVSVGWVRFSRGVLVRGISGEFWQATSVEIKTAINGNSQRNGRRALLFAEGPRGNKTFIRRPAPGSIPDPFNQS